MLYFLYLSVTDKSFFIASALIFEDHAKRPSFVVKKSKAKST